MYVRKLSKALRPAEVRELIDAEAFAKKRGKPLTASITVHPKLLTLYPDDIGRWIGWLTNKIRLHCERAGFGYFAIWVRENYEGERREHYHMLLHLPENQREALEHALRRWLLGPDNVVELGRPRFGPARYGRVNKALTYMLKQMTPQARRSLNDQVYREKRCRTTHALVAPVLGKRYGISRSLNANTQRTFWTTTPRSGRATSAAHRQVSSATA